MLTQWRLRRYSLEINVNIDQTKILVTIITKWNSLRKISETNTEYLNLSAQKFGIFLVFSNSKDFKY